MVRPINPEDKAIVMKLWASGLSREQISSKTGISTGSISNIVKEEKRRTPDIQELRDLNILLKKANISVDDAKRGVSLLDRLSQIAIPLERLPEAMDLYEQYGEKASEAVTLGQRVIQLEKRYGKSCEEILSIAEKMAGEIEIREKTITGLKDEEQVLHGSIREMESLKTLQKKLSQYDLTIARLDGFIAQNLGLEDLGFTLRTASLLASELERTGLDPQKAAAILADDLLQSKSLKESIVIRKKVLEDLEEGVRTKTVEAKGLEDQVAILKGQIGSLRELLEIEKGIQAQRQSKLEEKTKDLEDEVGSLEDQKAGLTKQREDLGRKINDLLDGLIKEEETLKKVEDKVKSDERLATIVLMIEDPKALPDQSSVKRASLAFLEGLLIYVRENQKTLSYSSKLMSEISDINKILSTEIRFEHRPTA